MRGRDPRGVPDEKGFPSHASAQAKLGHCLGDARAVRAIIVESYDGARRQRAMPGKEGGNRICPRVSADIDEQELDAGVAVRGTALSAL